ncbi:MAG: ADP-ribosylglycohydrolase family protein, partial [Phycisphaerales bacterium]|nr:ADP-ribosylglycohydrolase family protein [Phycisphaerales bacterium]
MTRPLAILACLVAAARAQHVLDRDTYADHLRAMWLAEAIANWTGWRAEGQAIEPPFFTDDDWGTTTRRGVLEFVLQDPFLADDDTDVEYVDLHLMTTGATPWLDADVIRDGWLAHMDDEYLWVSNLRALELMRLGLPPDATSMPAANHSWLMIDAQLTTEVFGALAPGMPLRALRLADLPIATTARGHAAHAAQYHVVLYALATQAPPGLPVDQQVVWLADQARRFIPDTSKVADIHDFVRARFDADPDDWEATRDAIHDRYQANDAAYGWRYRAWWESSVNVATGVMALLYGKGDLRRTIQIGTLSGWDADNPTATMGGLLGLMLGTDAVRDAFPGEILSDRYDIERTRDGLPDHLPGDPQAQDTFTLMSERMLPLVETIILDAGGLVDDDEGRWLLPPVHADPRPLVPTTILHHRSANIAVVEAGGTITRIVPGGGDPPPGYGVRQTQRFTNRIEHDASGHEPPANVTEFHSTLGGSTPPGTDQEYNVLYDRPVLVRTLRFIEGDPVDDTWQGGWFLTLTPELLVEGAWVTPPFIQRHPLDASIPFQVIDFDFDDT